MRFLLPAIIAIGLLPSATAANEIKTADDVRQCVGANLPDVTSVQAVEVRSTDRVGNDRVVNAKIYSRREADGRRRLLARFAWPEELVGSAFLLLEGEEGSELVMRTPEIRGVKRITGPEMVGSVAGTDFSFEDLQILYGLARNGKTKRLDDGVVDGRPAFVVQIQPTGHSAYESSVTFVDQETCLVLRSELYEKGNRLRKVMTVSPNHFRQVEAVWIGEEVVVRDVRDGTQSKLTVEGFDANSQVPGQIFSIEGFEAAKPEIPLEFGLPKPISAPAR